MLRFFSKQNSEESPNTDSRLRALEWKVNVILAIVAVHFLLSLVSFAGKLLLPSTTTIAIVSIAVIALGWFMRKQLLMLIKRSIARQIVGEEKSDSESPSSSKEMFR